MFIPLRPDEDILNTLDKLNENQREDLVKKCVHSIIILAQDRSPIRKQELNKLAFHPNTNYRIAAAIVLLANKQLNKVFGMRLFEVEDRTKYILVNNTSEFADLSKRTDDMCFELTVLYFILMDIFVSPDERVGEEDIVNSLKPLQISSESLKAYIDSFMKKLYIVVKNKTQETRQFSWGPRAIAEVDPEKFFIRFLELVEDTDERNWPEIRARVNKLKSLRRW